MTYDARDTFRPLGRWVSASVPGRGSSPRRFIYDADVRETVRQLRRSYPDTPAGAGTETAARYWIYCLGPDSPRLIECLALDLCLGEDLDA